MSSTLHCFATQAHLCVYASTSSSSGLLVYLFFSFWQAQVPYTNSQFQRFAKSIGPWKYVFTPIPSLNLPYISKCVSDFTLLSQRWSSPYFFYFFYCCLVPPKLLPEHHVFLASSYILPYFLNYAILPYFGWPFCYFLPIQLYRLWLATSCLACSLRSIAISIFSSLHLSRVGTFPVLLFNTVLQIVLEPASIFKTLSSVLF